MRQEVKEISFPKTKDNIVGLDIGYSAIKAISEDRLIKIPSYVRKIEDEDGIKFLGENKDTDIFYKDATGLWAIGLVAYKLKKLRNDKTGEDILVDRNRTTSEEFSVLANVGLGAAIGRQPKEKIIVQTGLPCSYIREDASILRTVLSGEKKFELKIGKNDWQAFNYEIKPENVKIMEQPFGSYFSVSFDKTGKYIDKSNENILVLDGGFKTLDIAQINEAISGRSITFDNLGMSQIFKIACEGIYKDYGADLSIFDFSDYLNKGKYTHRNKLTKAVSEIDLKVYYKKALNTVAGNIFNKVFGLYNGFEGVDEVILTGGTCEACKNQLVEQFKNTGIKVELSNSNDEELELSYSNARGYYLYRRCAGG